MFVLSDSLLICVSTGLSEIYLDYGAAGRVVRTVITPRK